MTGGGVTPSDFRVREEQAQKVHEETQWKNNYKRSGPMLVVRVRAQGTSESLSHT